MKTCAAIVLAFVVGPTADLRAAGESTVYDPNSGHLWNRLNASLFERTAQDGKRYGLDELDILYWVRTTNLLAGASHERALGVLDEFIRTHGEEAIRDPLKHAWLQRDLWQLFDWLAVPWPNAPDNAQRQELETRIALVMRRLALTTNEIAALPDNYRLTGSNIAPDLPRGLFETNGNWVNLARDFLGSQPIAPFHVPGFQGHSAFLVMLRLPEGRPATLAYLAQLNAVEHFWEYVTNPSPLATNSPGEVLNVNRHLPQFPTNTEWVIVRRMLTVDADGKLQPTPVTESIQLRRYLGFSGPETVLETHSNGGIDSVAVPPQRFFEFQMDRRHNGGLREVTPADKDFVAHFFTKGIDPFEWTTPGEVPDSSTFAGTVVERCQTCHSGPGIYSVNVYAGIFRPRSVEPPQLYALDMNVEVAAAMDWKRQQYSWGLLQGLWRRGR